MGNWKKDVTESLDLDDSEVYAKVILKLFFQNSNKQLTIIKVWGCQMMYCKFILLMVIRVINLEGRWGRAPATQDKNTKSDTRGNWYDFEHASFSFCTVKVDKLQKFSNWFKEQD